MIVQPNAIMYFLKIYTKQYYIYIYIHTHTLYVNKHMEGGLEWQVLKIEEWLQNSMGFNTEDNLQDKEIAK